MAQHGRPGVLLHHVVVGRQRHAGVDEAATADAIGGERDDTDTDMPVEQPRCRAHHPWPAQRRRTQVFGQLADVVREVAGQVFAATFQHHHRMPGFGQTQRRHGAAVARADHQVVDLFARLPVAQRDRQLGR